ncbi:hypothetical protein BH24DEI2_BH24DEI2_00950 [soil metagenome]
MENLRTRETRGHATHYRIEPIVPNRWQGECDCFVGPFSSKVVAEYFANAVVDFGQYETVSRKVFAKGDSWFVEVNECSAATVVRPFES